MSNNQRKGTNKDENRREMKRTDRDQDGNRDANRSGNYRSTELRDSPMMAHLLDALEQGQDIGEYGRLAFVMIARHFLPEDELVKHLQDQPGLDETLARAMVRQVAERGYNPPKRERILQWQARQDFQICPDTDNPTGCNVYRELQFPDEIYDQINDYWEERVESED